MKLDSVSIFNITHQKFVKVPVNYSAIFLVKKQLYSSVAFAVYEPSYLQQPNPLTLKGKRGL